MIRPATEDDVPALVALGEELHHLAPNYAALPFDGEHLAVHLEELVGGGAVFVAEEGAELVGGIVGFAVGMPSTPALLVSEAAFYVREGHRSLSVARGLVGALVAYAVEIGAVRVHIGVSSGIDDERTDRLFRRLGFLPWATSYCRPLPAGVAMDVQE